jgi:DNA-binding MarR family transcriptional regulator
MEVPGQAPDGQAPPEIGPTEKKALGAMMKMTFRTATGISKEIGLPRTQIGEVLDLLAAKKLVERTTSPTTGGPRWRITGLGVRALNAPGKDS